MGLKEEVYRKDKLREVVLKVIFRRILDYIDVDYMFVGEVVF